MTSTTFTFRPSTTSVAPTPTVPASVPPTPAAPASVNPTPAAPTPSFKGLGAAIPIKPLKPDNNDAYDWTQIQSVRNIPSQSPIKVTKGQTLPPISQALFDATQDDDSRIGRLSLEYSPQWFSLANIEQDDKGNVAITLRLVSGKTTVAGKVVRVAYLVSWPGSAGSGSTTEYYYQVA